MSMAPESPMAAIPEHKLTAADAVISTDELLHICTAPPSELLAHPAVIRVDFVPSITTCPPMARTVTVAGLRPSDMSPALSNETSPVSVCPEPDATTKCPLAKHPSAEAMSMSPDLVVPWPLCTSMSSD
jgi:hypothetical protein